MWNIVVVLQQTSARKLLLVMMLAAPFVSGCSSTSDMFSTDLLSKDAAWFSHSGRLFIRNVSIESPPLTPDKTVAPEDLISADGQCPGMEPTGVPADANALTETGTPRARPGV